MTDDTRSLEARLAVLPDASADVVHTAKWIRDLGLTEEVLTLLNETNNPTFDDVLSFKWEYSGTIEFFDEEGNRIPVDVSRLAFTSGMREHLADLKGKTLKSYQFAALPSTEGMLADWNVRINLGQHALDLNCYDFAFDIGGDYVPLGAWHCERMSLKDDFRPWTDDPWHAYAVGERITGVELVTDHVELSGEQGELAFDVDAAVAFRTASAVYTFSRESWTSSAIRIETSDDIAVPFNPAASGLTAAELLPGCSRELAKVTRSAIKLA